MAAYRFRLENRRSGVSFRVQSRNLGTFQLPKIPRVRAERRRFYDGSRIGGDALGYKTIEYSINLFHIRQFAFDARRARFDFREMRLQFVVQFGVFSQRFRPAQAFGQVAAARAFFGLARRAQSNRPAMLRPTRGESLSNRGRFRALHPSRKPRARRHSPIEYSISVQLLPLLSCGSVTIKISTVLSSRIKVLTIEPLTNSCQRERLE